MPLDDITSVVSLILALSAASERLVAILKSAIPLLDTPNTSPKHERYRVLALRVAAVAAGIFTAFLAQGIVDVDGTREIVGLGLLAAGGSDLWNSILGYLNGVKDVQKTKGEVAKVEQAASVAARSV
jgi:hypothetical protein